MQKINAKTLSVKSLIADFQQQKSTPMLTQPLISHGKLTILGGTMLWNTADPEPTQMHIDPEHIEIYYPDQKTLEIYNIEQKLASLAASPLPQLSVLAKYFTFEKLSEDLQRDEVTLKLLPIGEIRQHINEVDVKLNEQTGLVEEMTLVDGDQDRTTISFSHVQTNLPVKKQEVEISMPSGVKVTHPLAGLESEGP
jgi:outer membrane lipoprotein-sorting protein